MDDRIPPPHCLLLHEVSRCSRPTLGSNHPSPSAKHVFDAPLPPMWFYPQITCRERERGNDGITGYVLPHVNVLSQTSLSQLIDVRVHISCVISLDTT